MRWLDKHAVRVKYNSGILEVQVLCSVESEAATWSPRLGAMWARGKSADDYRHVEWPDAL